MVHQSLVKRQKETEVIKPATNAISGFFEEAGHALRNSESMEKEALWDAAEELKLLRKILAELRLIKKAVKEKKK